MTDRQFSGQRPWPPQPPEPPPQHYHAPPGQFGGPPYGAPPPWNQQADGRPPKRNVGLIVALVTAVVVALVGVGVGGVLLFLHDDDQESGQPTAGGAGSESATPPARDTSDPTKIRSACRLISAEELSHIVLGDIPIHSVEVPRSELGKNTYALRCGYNRDDNDKRYLSIDLAIIGQADVTPEVAVNAGKQPGAVPVQGVGEAALYYEREGLQVLDTAQRIGDYTVSLRLYGANPALFVDPFVTAGKKILAAAVDQSQ
jgi:hypothetical protein